MTSIHNFYAGPGALPKPVMEKVQADLFNYRGTGVSVMELSHRSEPIVELIEDTVARVRAFLALDADWEVLLLQGGGSQQFLMAPLNLSRPAEQVDYLDTGYWSRKAINEAGRCDRDVRIIASGASSDYNQLPTPEQIKTRADSRYLHLCTNNTVVGTQWHRLPDSKAPLVLDASSDFLSRRIPLDNVSCLYAHAQKNIGLAGVTVVAVRKDCLLDNELPAYLDYRSHIAANSNYHTPPVFSVYITNLMLRWLESEIGGLDAMAEINSRKARLLYDAIDNSKLFTSDVHLPDRSLMNVTFSSGSPDGDEDFISYCKQRGVIGVEGHRTRGGLRASLYNAVTVDNVQALVDAMQAFERAQ
ncbi:3-phosphoserine/phosphohydroxythreonine transaminase [Marinobacterium arenosum]|uniref:3-phosphoserine/phosphohydroxythreonine transaminase n=1 Tax=Marinobacterium arenosum TaxID=2862496 RepID=UPI001C941144|nr:3-phosphoserine/phosphohydroxythreonine transaminase [Marinobacterium arenosum]MBY4678893.1 3-phosphoserine/phosphohydroxythreonine transaminase [Marinobacterium arenosum]